MSLYLEYLDEIAKRKKLGLSPLPIENAELTSEIIEQIKDSHCEHRKESLEFFIYNTLPGTTAAAGVKSQFLKEIITLWISLLFPIQFVTLTRLWNSTKSF